MFVKLKLQVCTTLSIKYGNLHYVYTTHTETHIRSFRARHANVVFTMCKLYASASASERISECSGAQRIDNLMLLMMSINVDVLMKMIEGIWYTR